MSPLELAQKPASWDQNLPAYDGAAQRSIGKNDIAVYSMMSDSTQTFKSDGKPYDSDRD